MRAFMFLLSLFLVASTATAQESKSTMPKILGERVKEELRLDFLMFFNTANSIDFDSSSKEASVVDSAGAQRGFGIGLEAAKRFTTRFAATFGLGYEFNRNVKDVKMREGTVTGTDAFLMMPTFSLLLANASLKFNFHEQMYLLGGFNYSFPDVKSIAYTFESKIGWQAGAGVKFASNIDGELLYRVVNMEADQFDGVSYSNVSLEGLLLQGRYHF